MAMFLDTVIVQFFVSITGGQLQAQEATDSDWTGGIFMVFTLTWPSTAPTGYWNIELEGSDWFGNSESAFGAF
jgi:hypothetical protein